MVYLIVTSSSLVLRKTGYSFTDIQKSIKNAAHDRRQRNETIESLSHQKFDEAIESIGRKVQKLLRRNKKKKSKRNKSKKKGKHDKELLDDNLFINRGFPESVDFVLENSKEQKVHFSFDNEENKVAKGTDLDFSLHRRDSAQFQDGSSVSVSG